MRAGKAWPQRRRLTAYDDKYARAMSEDTGRIFFGLRRMRMDRGGAAVARPGGLRAISRYQWLVFLVVWLGWTLDAADFGLYSLVLRPALTELLGGNPPMAQIGRVGGLLSMMGLLGWAFGGFLFGIIADYIGRVRALAFSIVIYSVFTALQGLSHGVWDFAIYRFIAGLGTGAELMVGIPLLAEALGETHRAKIAGCMMTGGALGTFLGAWAYGLVGGYGWRVVFFIGVVPALLLAVMRRRVIEPDRFDAVRERRQAVAAGRRVCRRRPRVHALRAAAAVLAGASLQHHRRHAVRSRLAAGDLDHQHLAADDPVADGAEERRHRRGRGAVRQPRHDGLEPRRHLRLHRLRLHRRCDRPPRAASMLYSVGTIAAGLILYLGAARL